MDRYDDIDQLYGHVKQIKQRMETLENENLVLKAQLIQAQRELADLRRGVGITILIDGKPIAAQLSIAPDVVPTAIAALHTVAPTPPSPPGLFVQPAAGPPQPGGLFDGRPERPTRPDARGAHDFVY
jgi:hypothetical protein